LDRQEKAAERAKERREQAALRIKMKREEQEDAIGHLGEVNDSRFQKSKNKKNNTKKKKNNNNKDMQGNNTHPNSPKKPKSTFGDSPTRSMMINARDEDDEDDSIQSIQSIQNMQNMQNMQSNNESRRRNAPPQTRQHPSPSLYTFDRRFSRNQPIGMELEWSAKQGLLVKQVDSHGQASFLDVAKHDVVSHGFFFIFLVSFLNGDLSNLAKGCKKLGKKTTIFF